MNIRDSVTGFWFAVDSTGPKYTPFTNKIAALQYATANKQQIGFYFYNTIWENFDKSTLGKTSLTYLYAERARQLRDKYNYLVLHYSGGSDSHNILHTFLQNNIKLDEITVRWPKHWIDGKFYTPNRLDTSAKNAPSEFNYTIEPTLKYLQQHHPEIKINIVDFTENIQSMINVSTLENRISILNSSRCALASVTQRLDLNVNRNMSSVNDNNIGHIFGVEKPSLYVEDNRLYFYFSDVAFDTISMDAETNVEPFYWSGEFPQLTMEQIYQVGLFFKNNKQYIHLLNSPGKQVNQITADVNLQQNLIKNVLYKHSWDFSKFQVDKPNVDRSDWHSWIHESPELSKLTEIFDGVMRDITSDVDTSFLINTDKTPLLAPRRSKLFYLFDLD
jgi:hypothetical protein